MVKRTITALGLAALMAGLVIGTQTAAQAAACTVSLGSGCGGYNATSVWPGSNGFNTYDSNQDVGANAGTTETLTGPDPATATTVTPMTVTANAVPYGYTGVQTFPDVQQLTNNWDPATHTFTGSSDMPVDALPGIVAHYAETSPSDANSIYEFAPDVWTSYSGQAGSGSGDIMFWADTSPARCGNNGLSSTDIIGHVTLAGQAWTAYRYGGVGGEIVLILNTTSTDPVTTDTCAQQKSGAIDIKGGLDWLNAQGLVPRPGGAAFTMSQDNIGFEITSADNTTFTLTSYTNDTSGGTAQQPPAATTNAATGVTSSAATLNGSVNPNGADTTVKFEYGTSTSYGTSTAVQDIGAGTSAVNVSQSLTGLAASTTYHYRVDATNAAGTTSGADQQFTTTAAGGGSTVAYDATSSARKASSSSLSWTHAAGSGSSRALLVEATVGVSGDTGCGQTVTDNGAAMTKLAIVHTNNQHAGYMDIWGLANPPAGANNLVFSVSGCQGGVPQELTAGGESFTGVSQAAPFGTAVTAFGSSANPAATAASAANDMIAGFAANGSSITSVSTPATSRFIVNQDNLTGAGNSAGATAPSTGSSVTVRWNAVSDWWAAGLVQVQHA